MRDDRGTWAASAIKSRAAFWLCGRYRVQSARRAERGGLTGDLVVDARDTLAALHINEFLSTHPLWDRTSSVQLRAAMVYRRLGVFRRHADALYYRTHFVELDSFPTIDHDVLDVTKLRALYQRRIPLLKSILSRESFGLAMATVQPVESVAINEYMCHEGGHRIGYAIGAKMTRNFFRREGKVSWPLVYLEEYRADVNAWSVALAIQNPQHALATVLYTVMHRLGLSAENLRNGAPGAGYVPFLHVANLMSAGVLGIARSRTRWKFYLDRDADLLSGIRSAVRRVYDEVNRYDEHRDNDLSAEALLEHAAPLLSDASKQNAFLQVMTGR